MVTNAKEKEMRKRFPDPDILRAFSFIDPRISASLPAAEQLYGQIMKLAQIGMTL
jgi:hypothetical protein